MENSSFIFLIFFKFIFSFLEKKIWLRLKFKNKKKINFPSIKNFFENLHKLLKIIFSLTVFNSFKKYLNL